MLDSLGWGETGILLVLALFVLGPERLPSLAADLGRTLRRIRLWFLDITADITADLKQDLWDEDDATPRVR